MQSMVNEASDDTVEIYQTGHVVMVLHRHLFSIKWITCRCKATNGTSLVIIRVPLWLG